MQTIELSFWDMVAMFAVLLAPLTLLYRLKLGLLKDAIIAICRMTVQLILVGLYLKYIFELDSLFLNLLWMLVMVTGCQFHDPSTGRSGKTQILHLDIRRHCRGGSSSFGRTGSGHLTQSNIQRNNMSYRYSA